MFEVNGKRIKVVEEFKYLGCVTTEQMGSRGCLDGVERVQRHWEVCRWGK